MAVVPGSHTFVNGLSDSSEMNTYVRDPIAFLFARPIMRARSNAAQSIPTGVWTSVALALEDIEFDPSGLGNHDLVVNNSRYTATYPGWYGVSGTAGNWAANATNRRGVRIAVNGSVINASKTLLAASIAAGIATPVTFTLVYLNVGDYVEMQVNQDTGGALNLGSATADDNSSFTVIWESN